MAGQGVLSHPCWWEGPSHLHSSPGLSVWLASLWEKGLCFSLKVACPDCNPLLSDKENVHSHLICLDQRGSVSQTSFQMENKKLV